MTSSLFGGRGQATGMPSRQGLTGMPGNKIPKGYQRGSLQQFSPEQMSLLQQLLEGLGGDSFLSQLAGGSQEGFDEFEAPALRQFGQIQGNIASRFSAGGPGPGSLSSRHSSGFGHEMNSAASNFAQDLAAKRMGIQRQAMQDLYGLGNQLLGQRPYEQFLTKKEPSFLQKFLGAGAGAVGGGLAGFLAGGPPGAAIGAAGGGLSGYQGVQ
jgi:hypothetical protein